MGCSGFKSRPRHHRSLDPLIIRRVFFIWCSAIFQGYTSLVHIGPEKGTLADESNHTHLHQKSHSSMKRTCGQFASDRIRMKSWTRGPTFLDAYSPKKKRPTLSFLNRSVSFPGRRWRSPGRNRTSPLGSTQNL